MFNAFLATSVIFLMLVMSELLWRWSRIRGEFARKFVHIMAGTFIAFLPLWVSYGWISVLAVGFILANLLNRYTHLFHAIHAITRKSWGDLLFGVGILITSLVKPNKWIFVGAILQVALADGLAAVVGTHYGKKPYRILDHKKTFIGTCTFYISSLLILIFVITALSLNLELRLLILIVIVPLAMTLLENISGYGTDNVLLPLGFLMLMRLLSIG